MVQTGYRENRDPRTILGLEKVMRCELVSGEQPVSAFLPDKAQPGICADAPGLSFASPPPEDVKHPEACPALPSSAAHPQASWT